MTTRRELEGSPMVSESESSTRSSGRPPLRTPRVAEAVAAQLRLRIIEGDLADGSELPPENILLSEFPASRPSLREAFRILETEGLLTVRRGKRGGTVINSPTPETAAYHMGLLMHADAVSVTDLAAARNLIEPLCAEQAARRDDHAEVGASLRACNARAEAVLHDEAAFTDAAVQFHEALVDAAGNHTLRVIAGMLESVWSVQERDWAREAAEGKSYPETALREAVIRAHAAISDAIGTGDAEAAVRVTKAHLDASQLYVASHPRHRVRVLDEYGSSRMTFRR
jgi:GntR family transcriptional regulator, transcriptional repressor for pyruvate dehydrogenase complex